MNQAVHPCFQVFAVKDILSFSSKRYVKTETENHSVMLVLVAQLCPTLCDHMNFSSPGSSAHGILQARILEWVKSDSVSTVSTSICHEVMGPDAMIFVF